MLQRRKVISINISTGKYKDFIKEILFLAKKKESSYICVANVHMTIEAYNDENFKNIVNSADIITPDGMPLVKALKLLYRVEQDRVSGPDLMPDLLRKAESQGLSVFFYGSTEEVLKAIIKRARVEYPKLQIAGTYSPPFRELTGEEKEEIAELINDSGANIVFVSLGCPKQEKWMAEMKGKINAVMIGVGAAFPIYAGTQKRAPRWMQKLVLEWFYRLCQEPRRLFKRYFYTNFKFLYLISKELFRKKKKECLKK